MTENRIRQLLDRLGILHPQTRVPSLIFTHMAVLVGFLLAAAVLPDTSGNTRPARLDSGEDYVVYRYRINRDDQRGILGLDEFPHQDTELTLSWVAGSSIVLGPASAPASERTWLPATVTTHLKETTEADVRMNIFQVGGSGFADTYVAAKAALELEPDLLVLTGNPAWIGNDLVLSRYPNFRQRLAGDVAASMPVLGISLAQPGETLLSGLGKIFPRVNDHATLVDRIDPWRNRLDFVELVESSARTRSYRPGLEEQFARAQNDFSAFWWLIGGNWRNQQAERGYRIADGGEVANALLDDLVRTATDAGVPLYIYLAPTDLTLGPDEAAPLIDDKERILQAVSEKYPEELLLIDPVRVNRRFPDITFRDRWHVDEPGPMPRYLAEQICALAQRAGEAVDCGRISS